MNNKVLAYVCTALACMCTGALEAKTLRYAAQVDSGTLDPHSANILFTARLLNNVYEGLVTRDKDLRLVPTLATSWTQVDAKTWRFSLRPGVRFHDGSPFGADDVVFSVERVMHPNSQLKSSIEGVAAATKIDDLTVELKLSEPNPVLLNHLAQFKVMSRTWALKNGALLPQRYADKEETFAARNANGTGPYRIVSYEPDVKTVLRENTDWWNRASPDRGNVTEVVWRPIVSPPTRMAALMSSEVDFVIDPAQQDLDSLAASPEIRLVEGTEPRIIHLGFDVSSPELRYSSVKGRNPFADARVRHAVRLMVDVEAIRTKIYRNRIIASGSIVAPQVQGYAKDLDRTWKPDITRARKLMREAGYGDGFEVTLDCATTLPLANACKALGPMLAQVGIRVNVNLVPPPQYFPKIQKSDTSFWANGWGSTTFDSLYVVQSLFHTQRGGQSARGDYNLGRFSNARVDQLIGQLAVEMDVGRRNAMIREVLQVVVEEVPLVALWQPINTWAMRKNVSAPFTYNVPYFHLFRID